MSENEIIAGLDLGTTKVCAVVAEVTEEGLDVIKTENLYLFDGERGYSLGQGE